jgi:hypothetical protein
MEPNDSAQVGKYRMNEIVALLDSFGGDVLPALRAKFPQHADRLQPGLILGDTDTVRIDALTCLLALDVVIELAVRGTLTTHRRILNVSRLTLAGQILTAAAGASIFGVLAADAPKTAKYMVGILALIGTLITVGAQALSKVLGSGTTEVKYLELVEKLNEATTLRRSLSARLAVTAPAADILRQVSEMITHGNVLSKELRLLLAALGVAPISNAESKELLLGNEPFRSSLMETGNSLRVPSEDAALLKSLGKPRDH